MDLKGNKWKTSEVKQNLTHIHFCQSNFLAGSKRPSNDEDDIHYYNYYRYVYSGIYTFVFFGIIISSELLITV